MRRVLAVLALAAPLAACAAGGERYSVPPQASAPASGPSVIGGGRAAEVVAGPQACAGPIADYQRIIDTDVETGYLNPGVYNRVRTDLEPVRQACAAGRAAEANSRLAAVKQQYGYR